MLVVSFHRKVVWRNENTFLQKSNLINIGVYKYLKIILFSLIDKIYGVRQNNYYSKILYERRVTKYKY